jgi:hypothetical protein
MLNDVTDFVQGIATDDRLWVWRVAALRGLIPAAMT